VVPVQAVSQNGNEAAVLVVDMNNRIQNRRIELGLQNPNEAQVISGLNEGDRVVVSDRSGLRPGEEVRPQPVEPMHYQGEAGH
jgi:multidrug efflux pump subunit AcrA (membrane-fusion protein)